MKLYRRWLQAVSAALLLVLTCTAWVVFAPNQLGGQSVYVIINGNSMEPRFHYGDLVIAHRASDYQVGDIVVYRNADLKNLVFHRIIGLNLDHFVLKGDNNHWTDSYQPTREELLGKLWIYLPNAGNIVQWLRQPIVLAIMVGAISVFLGITLMMRSKPGKAMISKNKRNWLTARRPNTTTLATVSPARKSIVPGDKKNQGIGEAIEVSFFILGFFALASLILGAFAFTRPVWKEIADNVNYNQLGTFSYTATAPAGVYDSTTVLSGDPLFPKLTCTVDFQFDYALMADQARGLAGTHQITAIIMDSVSGWHRTLPLETQTAFNGNTFVTNASLDLCEVRRIIASMEEATDLHLYIYSLIINPRVAITGTLSERSLQTAFEPQLLFLFDQVHIYLYKSDAVTDPLNPSQAGLIQGTRRQANTLALLGLTLEVGKARILALVGLGLSLGGLLFMFLFISNKIRSSREALVRMKYGSMLVDIRDSPLDITLLAVDVITMDDLARLAERHAGTILHEVRGLVHYYFVQGDGVIYRFVLNEGGDSSPEVLSMQQMGDNLQTGFERGEFRVYYQPIVSLTDGKITAVESLLRWQDPERGLVSAAGFISVAEETGLIDKIGEWMLEVACTQFEEWQKAGIQIKLAVNFSKRQLKKDPAGIISRVLHKTRMDPHSLQIEIPEASIIENDPTVLHNMRKLRELGAQISVDGFTGQAPISFLEHSQINNVKIDRHIVSRISESENVATLSGMISAALRLGLNVVAEGVETEEQLGFLYSQQCTQAQGYFLGRPNSAQKMTELLQKKRTTG